MSIKKFDEFVGESKSEDEVLAKLESKLKEMVAESDLSFKEKLDYESQRPFTKEQISKIEKILSSGRLVGDQYTFLSVMHNKYMHLKRRGENTPELDELDARMIELMKPYAW